MGSRSRIRWHKVLKLGAGVFGCLALFLGLPSLIRRPEPPPLESDIGLAHTRGVPGARALGPATDARRRAARREGPPAGQAAGPAAPPAPEARRAARQGRASPPAVTRGPAFDPLAP